MVTMVIHPTQEEAVRNVTAIRRDLLISSVILLDDVCACQELLELNVISVSLGMLLCREPVSVSNSYYFSLVSCIPSPVSSRKHAYIKTP